MLDLYWEKCCLAHAGDTKPCATPCKHCARMSDVMMQEFETLRTQWLGMKDEIGVLRQAARRCIDNLQEYLPLDTATAGGPLAVIAHLKSKLHELRRTARDVIDQCDPDTCRGSFGSAIARLSEQLPEPQPRCNHWPGQKRCDVCGMGCTFGPDVRGNP